MGRKKICEIAVGAATIVAFVGAFFDILCFAL